MPSWPTDLPCAYQIQNLTMVATGNTLAIDPESGAPMTRVRFTGQMRDISGSLVFRTRQQAISLLEFYRDDLSNGSVPFDWSDPVTGDAVSMIFMAAPQISRDGIAYSASLKLRTLP